MRRLAPAPTPPPDPLLARVRPLLDWDRGLQAPPPVPVNEQDNKGTITCDCNSDLIPDDQPTIIRIVRPNASRGSIQNSIPVPDPARVKLISRPRHCRGAHTCCSIQTSRQLLPVAPYGPKPTNDSGPHVPDADSDEPDDKPSKPPPMTCPTPTCRLSGFDFYLLFAAATRGAVNGTSNATAPHRRMSCAAQLFVSSSSATR